jgi:large subunit ribosomal protein L18e
MGRRRRTEKNQATVALIEHLKFCAREHQAPLWRTLARALEKPARNWAAVNLARLERYASEQETIVVPGKVLGAGKLTKKLTVGACSFSESARRKIHAAKGKALSLEELVAKNPKGSGVRVMR